MRSFITAGTLAGPSTTVDNWLQIFAQPGSAWQGAESNVDCKSSFSWKIIRHYVLLSNAPGVGKSYRFATRWQGQDSSVVVQIADNAVSGVYNGPGSVSYADNDAFAMRCSPIGTPTALTSVKWYYEISALKSFPLFGRTSGVTSNAVPQYLSPQNGQGSWLNSEAQGRIVIPIACKLRSLRAGAVALLGTGTSYDLTIWKNGSPSILTVNIVDGLLINIDNIHEISIAPGDTISFETKPNGTPTQRDIRWCLECVPTTIGQFFISFGNNVAPSTSAARYNGANSGRGGAGWDNTEANRTTPVPDGYELNALYAKLGTAPGAGKSYDIKARLNAVDKLTVNIAGTDVANQILGQSVRPNNGDLIVLSSIPHSSPVSITDGIHTGISAKIVGTSGPGDCYHGAYLNAPDTYMYYYTGTWDDGPFSATTPGGTWDTFERHISGGVNPATKTMSCNNFGTGFRYGPFPTGVMNNIIARGCIPGVNIAWGAANTMPYNGSYWTNDQIIAGDNDVAWTAWFTAAAAWGKPFFLMPCVEFNGSWTYEGGLNNSGNFPGPNNPTNFIGAWRHLKDLADSLGATNITWCWIPNAIAPGSLRVWDAIEDFDPGPTYKDWGGGDVFNYSEPFGDFTANWQPTYDRIRANVSNGATMPMMLSQIASSAGPNDGDPTVKVTWLNSMFAGLPNFRQVKCVLWFNWRHADAPGYRDEDIESPYDGSRGAVPLSDTVSIVGMAAAQAYANGISDPRYLNKLTTYPSSGKVPIPADGSISLPGRVPDLLGA